MVLVDTSVWVDFLRANPSPQVLLLKRLLDGSEPVVIAPPILQEILQGAGNVERQSALRRRFADIPCIKASDQRESAQQAALLYLNCRVAGHTVRASNDCLIACIAIEHGCRLLQSDRDYDAIRAVDSRLQLLPVAVAHQKY